MSTHLNNTRFSRLGILQSDGTMLVLGPREAVDPLKISLDNPHLTRMLSKGYLTIREGAKKMSEKKSPSNPAAVLQAPVDKPADTSHGEDTQ